MRSSELDSESRVPSPECPHEVASSLYWRIAAGFVACLALLLVVQAMLFVWVVARSGSTVPNQPPDRFAQTIAVDASGALERDPSLDIEAYLRQEYSRDAQPFFVVMADGRTLQLGASFPAPMIEEARAAPDVHARARRAGTRWSGRARLSLRAARTRPVSARRFVRPGRWSRTRRPLSGPREFGRGGGFERGGPGERGGPRTRISADAAGADGRRRARARARRRAAAAAFQLPARPLRAHARRSSRSRRWSSARCWRRW